MITDIEITEVFPIPIGDVYIRDENLLNGLVDEIYAEMERDPVGTKSLIGADGNQHQMKR